MHIYVRERGACVCDTCGVPVCSCVAGRHHHEAGKCALALWVCALFCVSCKCVRACVFTFGVAHGTTARPPPPADAHRPQYNPPPKKKHNQTGEQPGPALHGLQRVQELRHGQRQEVDEPGPLLFGGHALRLLLHALQQPPRRNQDPHAGCVACPWRVCLVVWCMRTTDPTHTQKKTHPPKTPPTNPPPPTPKQGSTRPATPRRWTAGSRSWPTRAPTPSSGASCRGWAVWSLARASSSCASRRSRTCWWTSLCERSVWVGWGVKGRERGGGDCMHITNYL